MVNTGTDRISRWQQALLLPGHTQLTESSLHELAEYFGINQEEALHACETAVADSKREWESAPRDTREEVLKFYRSTRSYLFEHVWWHATDVENNSGNVGILEYALQRRVKEYLDFGSGVGANAILAAQLGVGVTLADVSGPMLDFARWRLQRRGLKATYVNLNHQELPRACFDLVTVVDVFEHLVDPGSEISRIAAATQIGGLMIFNNSTGPDPDRPMHIVLTLYPILRSLRRHGFRDAARESNEVQQLGYRVLTKTGHGAVLNVAWGLYDGVRYGSLGLLAKSALGRLRALRRFGKSAGRMS